MNTFYPKRMVQFLMVLTICLPFFSNTAIAAAPEISLTYLYTDLPHQGSLDLGNCRLNANEYSSVIALHNTGDASLNISSVSFTGTNADIFFTDLTTGTVDIGSVTYFKVWVNSASAGSVTAQMIIENDDVDEGSYTINLSASLTEGINTDNLYGPQDTPPLDLLFSSDGNGIGRSGGLNYRFANVNLAGHTPLYWGTFEDSNGDIEVKLSMNDNTYDSEEIMQFSTELSDLTNGKLVWLGKTSYIDYLGASHVLYTRLTLTATQTIGGALVSMVAPGTVNKSRHSGGFVVFNSVSDAISVNMIFESSSTFGTGYQPYLDMYDGLSTVPNAPGPVSSFWPSFFWNNVAPKLSANQGLDINENETTVLTTQMLNGSDPEDDDANTVFEFDPNSGTGSSVVRSGKLTKDGVELTNSDVFSVADISNGLIAYVHNGSEDNTTDEFIFKLKDSKGAYATDGPYSTFTFDITITIVNDPPVTTDYTFDIDCTESVSGTVEATDEEGGTITFNLVSSTDKGTLTFSAETGEYSWTGDGTSGNTQFVYRASDGNSFGSNSYVYINISNAVQTITFNTPADIPISSGSINLTASTTSGLDIAYSTVNTDLMTINGNVATLIGVGSVTVVANQAGDGCYSAADPVSVTFCIDPNTPVITSSGLNSEEVTLTSSAASGNQWHLDNTAIDGETAQDLLTTTPGIYTVDVTENGCTSEQSDPFSLIITSFSEDNDIGMRIYPNPTRQTITVSGLTDDFSNYKIIDLTGRIMQQGTLNVNRPEIEIEIQRSGQYILRLYGNGSDAVINLPFIKN